MTSHTKERDHLKHLLFNDAMMTHAMGMNNNAMDRSCVYEIFIEDITNKNFDEIYDDVFRKYRHNRDDFSVIPCHVETFLSPHTDDLMSDNSVILSVDDVSRDEFEISGGYWDSLEQADEYVEQYATDETVSFLIKKHFGEGN